MFLVRFKRHEMYNSITMSSLSGFTFGLFGPIMICNFSQTSILLLKSIGIKILVGAFTQPIFTLDVAISQEIGREVLRYEFSASQRGKQLPTDGKSSSKST